MAKNSDLAPVEDAMQIIRGQTLVPVEDSTEAQYAIAEEILNAGTLEDAFKQRKSIASRDIVGKPIEVLDVTVRQSTLEGKQGNYLLVNAIDLETGEMFVMNTGAPNIVALLFRATQLGAMPLQVTVIEAAPPRAGRNAPLTLAPYGRTADAIATAEQAA